MRTQAGWQLLKDWQRLGIVMPWTFEAVTERVIAIETEAAALQDAWGKAERLLPEGWGIGVEYRDGGYQVGAGKNEWTVGDQRGYTSLAEALLALAEQLAALPVQDVAS